MSDDRVILLTNRGDGVDEVPNDEEYIEDGPEETSGNLKLIRMNGKGG